MQPPTVTVTVARVVVGVAVWRSAVVLEGQPGIGRLPVTEVTLPAGGAWPRGNVAGDVVVAGEYVCSKLGIDEAGGIWLQ
jgi:hypothetical protein